MEKSTLGTDNPAEKSNINPKCNDPLVNDCKYDVQGLE